MLAKPLTNSQIQAACKFWKDGHWEVEAFAQLRQCFPKPQEAVTLKAVAVNTLYSAGVRPIARVAQYLEKRLGSGSPYPTGPELVSDFVKEIADLKLTKRDNHYHVFVSKFAHFFINPDLPILDQYSEWMVEQHLGLKHSYDSDRYLKFAKNIQRLKEEGTLTCDCDELDHYLWIAGEYWSWKHNPKKPIYTELRDDFERLEKTPETERTESQRTLAELLGITVRSAPL